MHLFPGLPAPVFTLYDSDKQKFNLESQRGSTTLLLFFPLAFTSVCTRELCEVRDSLQVYNDLDTTVLGISVDSLYTLNRYKADQQLNFALLSDFNKEVSAAYGCLYEQFGFEMKGVGKRAAFVLDGSLVIRYAEVLDNASEVPDFTAILKTLAGLRGI